MVSRVTWLYFVLREHLTFVKSLVKPQLNPLLGKEREQESGVFAKLRCSLYFSRRNRKRSFRKY
jgi:hypothetical protein